MKSTTIIIRQHNDGYVGYVEGLEGVVVGEGETYNEALQDVESALAFHLESFGGSKTNNPV